MADQKKFTYKTWITTSNCICGSSDMTYSSIYTNDFDSASRTVDCEVCGNQYEESWKLDCVKLTTIKNEISIVASPHIDASSTQIQLTVELMREGEYSDNAAMHVIIDTITKFASAFDAQTKDWDWSTIIFGRDQAITFIAMEIYRQFVYKDITTAEQGVDAVLRYNYPSKFHKEYYYRIPTGNNLYGGFDNGIVVAMDEDDAKQKAIFEITEGFEKINSLLVANELPTFEYDLDELVITLHN